MREPKHLYARIYRSMKEGILDGNYRTGDKLPTEYELMERFKVSRDTVRKAMGMLVKEYLVTRIASKGTFVTCNRAERRNTKLRSFSEIMNDENSAALSKDISIRLLERVEPEIQLALHLTSLHRVYKVQRMRYKDDEPFSLETVYIPYHLCPDLHQYIKPHSSLFKLYEAIYQHRIGESRISICAELPTAETAAALGISPGTPILKTVSLGLLWDDTPLYYAISQYEGSKYIYKTTMKRREG